MSLLTDFHTVLEEHNLKNSKCSFCGVNEATSLAHIISNTKFNNLAVQKRLNISEAIAQDLLDMPMLNIIYSCPACNGMGFTINGVKSKTCKTADITVFNKDIIRVANEIFENYNGLEKINFEKKRDVYYIMSIILLLDDVEDFEDWQHSYQNLLIGRWA